MKKLIIFALIILLFGGSCAKEADISNDYINSIEGNVLPFENIYVPCISLNTFSLDYDKFVVLKTKKDFDEFIKRNNLICNDENIDVVNNIDFSKNMIFIKSYSGGGCGGGDIVNRVLNIDLVNKEVIYKSKFETYGDCFASMSLTEILLVDKVPDDFEIRWMTNDCN